MFELLLRTETNWALWRKTNCLFNKPKPAALILQNYLSKYNLLFISVAKAKPDATSLLPNGNHSCLVLALT